MKRLTKLTSVILAVILLLSSISVAVLAADKAWPNHNIQVYVEGFGTQKIYNEDDPDQRSILFPFDMEYIKSKLGKIALDVLIDTAKTNPDLVYNLWYQTVNTVFGDTRLNEDGTASANPKIVSPPMEVQKDMSYGRYNFLYDSRLDPVDLSKTLFEYMNEVYKDPEAQSMIGSDGVLDIELIGSSYGTAVVCAFLHEYCPDGMTIADPETGMKIKFTSVTLCVPAVRGVDLVSQLFKGDFHLDYKALIAFLSGLNMSSDVQSFVDFLQYSGLLRPTVDHALMPAMQALLDKSLHDSIRDIFGTFPAFWAFVTEEDFEEALAYVYDTPEAREKYSGLIEKVRYYNDNIKVNVPTQLKTIEAAGTPVKLIVKYDKPMIPLLEEGNVMSDGLVTTRRAGMGTTCAPYGETLHNNYIASNPTHVFSPDRILDVSTGLFPQTTWYIKNLGHGKKPDTYYSFLHKISTAEAGFDVHSDESYPQFVVFEGDSKATTGTIKPLVVSEDQAPGSSTEPETKSFFVVIWDFFKMLWNKFIALFK